MNVLADDLYYFKKVENLSKTAKPQLRLLEGGRKLC